MSFQKVIKKKMGGRKVGLFGGTFNPIHLGHLRGAEEIRDLFQLEEVIFVPSSIPPHKPTAKVVEANHRLEMVRIAVSGNPCFSVSDIEVTRTGKSYSVETIKYFQEKGRDAFYFILGSDAFGEIETWREFKNLFSLCNFIVMTRPGSQEKTLSLPRSIAPDFRYVPEEDAWLHVSGQMLYFKEISFLDISSTKIRKLIEKERSFRYLVPPEIETYIGKHLLYRGNS